MIFYFTGTGNSLYVAERLAALTNTRAVSIAEIMKGRPMPEITESAGIVFPVYAWAPPRMVSDFVRRYPIACDYLYSVCTCGDEAGYAMARLEKALKRPLNAAWSIRMPNNYIAGFDVDSEAEARQKLTAADARIPMIAADIIGKRHVHDVLKGPAAGLKSAIIAPAFNAFATSAKPFYAEATCIGCKRCEAVCPTDNIRVAQKPVWGAHCTCCLACIHHCPVRAIQRGRHTTRKGRYVNPNCTVGYSFEKGAEDGA